MAEIKWLVRAGEDGYLIDEFARGFVAIGWHKIGDLSAVNSDEEISELYNRAYPDANLRAMGYKTRVMPKGRDRGVDVLASRDGLGLEEPRIKVEVKHRSGTSMGSQDIRSFLGGLREGEKALYISTGGFTQEAKYEADRSKIPLTLLELNDLADLIVDHYENFDIEGKRLMPLVKVYFPTE